MIFRGGAGMLCSPRFASSELSGPSILTSGMGASLSARSMWFRPRGSSSSRGMPPGVRLEEPLCKLCSTKILLVNQFWILRECATLRATSVQCYYISQDCAGLRGQKHPVCREGSSGLPVARKGRDCHLLCRCCFCWRVPLSLAEGLLSRF